MSENKHTPEPWAYYDDRKSTGRIEIVGLGKTVSRIYLSVPDEDVANARRIVACVNACAGIDTELLEIIADNDKTLAGVIANVEKQRDELLAALEHFATWARCQHRAQSKGCHATFDMMMMRDEIDFAEAAIASVKELK